MSQEVNTCCPVCGTWFYRKPGTRQKYDKPLCRQINHNKAVRERRKKKKTDARD